MKMLLDAKTAWVPPLLISDYSPVIKDILQIIKSYFPHIPPPTDTPKSRLVGYDLMDSCLPTPIGSHRDAIYLIINKLLSSQNMLRWADRWSENADGYFRFEIIAVSPNQITGNIFA
jgi:hypothetical protein